MKSIVNVFLTAAFVAASFASVQKSYGQITVAGKECVLGIRAGLNFTKLGGNMASAEIPVLSRTVTIPAKMKPGIQLGVVASYPLNNEKLMFQPGIVFAQQGAKWKDSGTETFSGVGVNYSADIKMTLNYLQVPLNLLYRHDLNSGGMVLLLQAGPYLGLGLGGKMKMDTSTSWTGGTPIRENSEEDIQFGGDKNKHDFKLFDIGLGLGAGLLFNEKYHVSLGYNIGLADTGHYLTAKNKGFALTLCYMFGN